MRGTQLTSVEKSFSACRAGGFEGHHELHHSVVELVAAPDEAEGGATDRAPTDEGGKAEGIAAWEAAGMLGELA